MEFFRFLEQYEAWGYVIFGGIGLLAIRKMFLAWRDVRNAIFGLERDLANRRFISHMTVVILMILVCAAEFTLVSFVVPGLPALESLATPTISMVSTATLPVIVQNGTQLAPQTPIAQLATPVVTSDGCIPGKIEWQSPKAGEEISGSVKLEGTVNPDNFGFYKYEFTQSGSDSWTTIAAGNEKHIQGELGTWITNDMPQGDYFLRLVVFDNKSQPYPACVLPVTITAP
jgi:hypothetical protein